MTMNRWLALFIAALLFAASLFVLLWNRSKPPPRPLSPPLEERRLIRLFFAKEEGLAEENRLIRKRPTTVEEAKEALWELIKGPSQGLSPTIPGGTKLLGVFIDAKGIAYVDFDRKIREGHPGGSFGELLTVYSVVETLTANFPEVKKVQILIEGSEQETLAGHLDIRRPLAPRFSFQPGV